MKHVGKIKGSDTRCVVVNLTIPGREDHALVIAGNMPPRIEQAVMQLLESNEGQQSLELADYLYRRSMPDTGKNVLLTLHEMGLLTAIPVDKIIMMPRPNTPVALKDILEAMKAQNEGLPVPSSANESALSVEKFNQFVNNSQSMASDEKAKVARNLLFEAQMMEEDARAIMNQADTKKRQAYILAPELAPVYNTNIEVPATTMPVPND